MAFAMFAMSCKSTEDKAKKNVDAQISEVREKTADAVEDMKEYTFAQKKEFVDKMQTQLDSINSDLDQLSITIEASSDSIKTIAKPKLKALRTQSLLLKHQIAVANDATESAWEEIKAGFVKGIDEIKEGFNSTRQWVSDKAAP